MIPKPSFDRINCRFYDMNKNAIVDGQIQVESPLSEPESQDIGMNVVEGLFFFA